MSSLQIIGAYGAWDDAFSTAVDKIKHEFIDTEKTTELCEIMARHGSDKGLGSHNYTKLYSALYEHRRSDVFNVFEVGLGTNNEDVPSSMGAKGIPGASLRGWREYFPNSSIVGGDVDKRILFQEDRITTFYMDQLDSNAIREMWSQVQADEFDLVIDDGLHTFQANSNFAVHAFDKVKAGGYFIVEDIVDYEQNLLLFDAFLRGFRRPAALLRLPHATNKVDNVIAMIAG
jgi:hypothetical protein